MIVAAMGGTVMAALIDLIGERGGNHLTPRTLSEGLDTEKRMMLGSPEQEIRTAK